MPKRIWLQTMSGAQRRGTNRRYEPGPKRLMQLRANMPSSISCAIVLNEWTSKGSSQRCERSAKLSRKPFLFFSVSVGRGKGENPRG